jgi:PII-like signaling protein
MLQKGAAKKVTVYINEDTHYHGRPLHEAILQFLLDHGVSGATATRAMAGFGAHRVVHTPKVEALGEHLPLRIEFIETAEKTDRLLPALYDMVEDGVIEVQDTTVLKAARRDRPEPRGPHRREAGPARMMRIFLGEADQWEGEPLYDAIVKKLRMMEIAGATVYRGIYGYGAKGHEHRGGFFHLSRDLPVMITVVDAPEKLERAAEAIEAMMSDGLIVISSVDMVRLVRELPDAAV